MLHYIKKMAPLAFAAIIMSSCADTETKKLSAEESAEETEMVMMDSTATTVKENTSALEAQTKKVETSLESIDAEFDSTK